MKIRSEKEHQKNSPWNIAAEFDVNMGFDAGQIKEMLLEYDQDHCVGMNVDEMAELLYSYTSGYPFLVSRLCKILDEKIFGCPGFWDMHAVWTKDGFLEAIKILSFEKNPLFESLVNKLDDYPELRDMLHAILFTGDKIPYSPANHVTGIASMFGFIKNDHGSIAIANRIFEMLLYDLFMSEKEINSQIFKEGAIDRNHLWG